jgi:FkbM family methyltransferase
MRYYLLIFISAFVSLNGVEEHHPIHMFSEVTVYDGRTNDLYGPSLELDRLKDFPEENYTIYNVESLGSFHVDYLHDTIKNALSRGELWESNIVELIKKFSFKGTVAVDAGSHIGTHLVSMSQAVGEEGYVLGFEPQMKLFSELYHNMQLNQCKNVRAYRCALGRDFNQIQMNVPYTSNEGGTSIGEGGDFAPLIPLDSFNLNNVSLIKIDVEGYEDEFLIGAKETIRRNQPFIIIELMDGSDELLAKRDRTMQILEEMGYSFFKLWGWDWVAVPADLLKEYSL